MPGGIFSHILSSESHDLPDPMFGVCYEYDHRDVHRDRWMYLLTAFQPIAYERNLPEKCPMTELYGINSIASVDELPVGPRLVVIAPKSAMYFKPTIALPDYKHPESAIYFFGKDTGNVSDEDLDSRAGDYDCVYIPMASELQNHELYSSQAATIVFYDRLAKSWQ